MLNSSNFANGIILESAGNILLDLALDPVKYPEVSTYTYSALLDGKFYIMTPGIAAIWGQCYKTFYGRKLRIFIIS
jgi:hypothetical protein